MAITVPQGRVTSARSSDRPKRAASFMAMWRSATALALLLIAACDGSCGARGAVDAGTVAAREAYYPLAGGTVDPFARRVCDALHTAYHVRRAECCSSAVTGDAAEVCARALTAALGRSAVSVAQDALSRCVADTTRLLEGCDWVFDAMPDPPASCRALVRGRLAEGAPCLSPLECEPGLSCEASSADAAPSCAKAGTAIAPCPRPPTDALAVYTRQLDLGGRCLMPEAPATKKGAGEPCTDRAECKATCITSVGGPGRCGTVCEAWPILGAHVRTAPPSKARDRFKPPEP